MIDPTEGQLFGLTRTARAYAVAVVDALREAGLPAVIVEGFRPRERQAQLYAQGRTTPGKIVTHTLNSRHTSREAWDVAFMVGGRVTYAVPPSWWSYLGAVAEWYGLRWGGRWRGFRDRPHVEMP